MGDPSSPPGADLTTDYGWYREDIAAVTHGLTAAIVEAQYLMITVRDLGRVLTDPRHQSFLPEAARRIHQTYCDLRRAWRPVRRHPDNYSFEVGPDRGGRRLEWGRLFRLYAGGIVRMAGLAAASAHDLADEICSQVEWDVAMPTEAPAWDSLPTDDVFDAMESGSWYERTHAHIMAGLAGVVEAFGRRDQDFDFGLLHAMLGRESSLAQHHARLRKALAVPADPAREPEDQSPEQRTDSGYSCALTLATEIDRPVESVRVFLTRHAADNPDCRNETKVRGRGEPRYTYRRADVLPALRKHFGV